MNKTKITEKQIERCKTSFEERKKVAKELGICYPTLRKWLVDAGHVPKLGRGRRAIVLEVN